MRSLKRLSVSNLNQFRVFSQFHSWAASVPRQLHLALRSCSASCAACIIACRICSKRPSEVSNDASKALARHQRHGLTRRQDTHKKGHLGILNCFSNVSCNVCYLGEGALWKRIVQGNDQKRTLHRPFLQDVWRVSKCQWKGQEEANRNK